MSQTLGVVLAVISLLGMGMYPVLLKKVVKELGEYTCLVFNYLVLMVLLGVTAVFTIKLTMPSDLVVGAIILGAIVGALAIYLYYKAIKVGHVSVVVVIASSNIIWSVIASYFLFKEQLDVFKYIAIGVILLGVIFVSMEKLSLPRKLKERNMIRWMKSNIWSKGAGLALMVSFCWAFYNLVIKYNVQELGPHKAVVYMEVLLFVLLLFAFLGRPAHKLVKWPKKEQWKWLAPSGGLFALGAVGLYFAMSQAQLSVVIPIVNAGPIAAVVGAAALLQERVRVHQYIGILMAIAGIVVLSI